MARPEFQGMSLPELVAWDAALRLAVAALEQAGGGVMRRSMRMTRGSR